MFGGSSVVRRETPKKYIVINKCLISDLLRGGVRVQVLA